jgi:hypothetical protein
MPVSLPACIDPSNSASRTGTHTLPQINSRLEYNRDSSVGRLRREQTNPVSNCHQISGTGLTLPNAPEMPRAGKSIDSLFDTALEGSSELKPKHRPQGRFKGFFAQRKGKGAGK